MKVTKTLLIAAVLLIATGTAQAALVPAFGGQVVNDTDLNITWLANGNLAATNTFGVIGINADGSMSWNTAKTWIGAMNSANYLGYNDWRLPATTDFGNDGCNFSYYGTDCGFSSTGSEMTHLFFDELGNTSYYNSSAVHILGTGGLRNVGPFNNLQRQNIWWSGTEYAPDTRDAWFFYATGSQNHYTKSANVGYALVVRPGQISAVPVPSAAWLLGSGLIGLVSIARIRKAA